MLVIVLGRSALEKSATQRALLRLVEHPLLRRCLLLRRLRRLLVEGALFLFLGRALLLHIQIVERLGRRRRTRGLHGRRRDLLLFLEELLLALLLLLHLFERAGGTLPRLSHGVGLVARRIEARGLVEEGDAVVPLRALAGFERLGAKLRRLLEHGRNS